MGRGTLKSQVLTFVAQHPGRTARELRRIADKQEQHRLAYGLSNTLSHLHQEGMLERSGSAGNYRYSIPQNDAPALPIKPDGQQMAALAIAVQQVTEALQELQQATAAALDKQATLAVLLRSVQRGAE